MAHKVKLNLNANVVSHQDVSIEVASSGGGPGTLLVSKGNIDWLPTPKSTHKHRLFARVIEGKPARATPKTAPQPVAARYRASLKAA